jgi:hypothetical protein
MFSILLLAVLTGPLPKAQPTLTLRIHLGNDFASSVIRSELARTHPWFALKRQAIEQNYRLVIDDDEFDGPSYSIGRGAERQVFRPGSFRASGCFMRALESICEVDRYERENADCDYESVDGRMRYSPLRIAEHRSRRPAPWPSQPPKMISAEFVPADVPPVEFAEEFLP